MQSALSDLHSSSLLLKVQDSQGFNKPGLSPHSKHRRSDLARDSSSSQLARGSSFPQPPTEAESALKSLWSLRARPQIVSVQLLRQCKSLGHPMREGKEKVVTSSRCQHVLSHDSSGLLSKRDPTPQLQPTEGYSATCLMDKHSAFLTLWAEVLTCVWQQQQQQPSSYNGN